jgi:hypothetical protein
MYWLKEHGVTSNADDYAALPLGVLEDCRLLMDADAKRAEWEARRGNRV